PEIPLRTMVRVTQCKPGVTGTMHHQSPPGELRFRQGKSGKETTAMTDTNEAVLSEALSVIDKALAQMLRRELVSSGEVTDVLLDVRTLLTLPATTAAEQ